MKIQVTLAVIFLAGVSAFRGTGMAAPAGSAGEASSPPPIQAAAGRETANPDSPAAHREPLSLEEIEIRGDLLFPQAVYIVAGAEDDAMAAASVLDYLSLEPGIERIGLLLILDESVPEGER
jgi:hypothetical protein